MPEKNGVMYTNGRRTLYISNALMIGIVTLLVAFLPNIHDKSDASATDVEKITKRLIECEKESSLHNQHFEFIKNQLIDIKKDLEEVKSELKMIWRGECAGDL